jgi:hypothetical protein
MWRGLLSIAVFLALLRLACSQSNPVLTSTTLKAQTANNTSASAAFQGMSNGNAPPSHVSKLPLRSLLYSGATTKIYARVVPFFLKSQKHVNVGYQSDDLGQAQRQVEDMMSRGIDGAIVDWYGTENPDLGRAAFAFRDQAEKHPGFTFVISEDKGALKHCAKQQSCDLNQHLIDDLNYAYDNFENGASYLRQDGRPIVFFFDVNLDPIDWSRVRRSVRGNPLFVFRNAKAFSLPESDGAFVWVDHTGNREMPYLDDFYKSYLAASRSRRPLMFASVYKGFDDSAASWGEGRVTNHECGQVWLDTFAKVNRYFQASNPLDSLEVVTWNDYEEGTEIETGVDDCVEIRSSISGRTLTWTTSGNAAAIDHFTIYASSDGQNLIELKQVPSNIRSSELDGRELLAGHYQIFVQVVGKPSVTDKMSSGVSWTLGAK